MQDKALEAAARAIAQIDGYDPDETWEEFNRNAAATDMMCGGVPDEEIFPVFVRWREYITPAQAAIAAYLAQREAEGWTLTRIGQDD